MNSYKYLYLFWLVPAAFLFLTLHQVSVYYSLTDTYENGESYTAEVLDFELKQIAAQTNGFIVLQFNDEEGNQIQRKLSLPVEVAGQLQQMRVIPVRYQPDASQEIVIMPTYETHKNLVWTNIAMAAIALLILIIIAIFVHRYTNKKLRGEDKKIVFERID